MKLFNTTQRGYRYNKIVFWVAMIIIFSSIFSIMYKYNFDFGVRPYFNCKQARCENPFYLMKECKMSLTFAGIIPIYNTPDCKTTCKWCNSQYLTLGEYGEKPDNFLFNNIGLISFILIVGAFLVNHFLFNRGKTFDIEIPITKKLIINRDFIEKRKKENEENKNNGAN